MTCSRLAATKSSSSAEASSASFARRGSRSAAGGAGLARVVRENLWVDDGEDVSLVSIQALGLVLVNIQAGDLLHVRANLLE